MKQGNLLVLVFLLMSFPLSQAQDMAMASASAQDGYTDLIQVNLNTQIDNAWEFSGNIVLNNTTWANLSEETGMTFHNLETMDDILAEELDRMAPPEVALVNFSASIKDQQVNIDWTSLLSELKIAAFYVQRSADGSDWTNIGMFSTENRSKVMVPYSFVDNQPLKGTNFYRLRQIDENEDAHYSDIIAVELMDKGYHVTHMYPHPVVFGADIEFELFEPATVNIQLFDAEGKDIGTIYSDITSIGKHVIELNLDQLPRGLYTCEIQVGNSTSKRTLIK